MLLFVVADETFGCIFAVHAFCMGFALIRFGLWSLANYLPSRPLPFPMSLAGSSVNCVLSLKKFLFEKK